MIVGRTTDLDRVTAPSLMLHGERVSLRPVREADLDEVYAAHTNIANRGRFFPLGVSSESAFRRDFSEGGFWRKEEGLLLIVGTDGEIVGHIEFFKPVSYWDAFELSYQLYDDRFAGLGWVTEAVQLLGATTSSPPRSRSASSSSSSPDNAASMRVADKCGFALGGHGPRRVLQRRPQPGRAVVLVAAHATPGRGTEAADRHGTAAAAPLS